MKISLTQWNSKRGPNPGVELAALIICQLKEFPLLANIISQSVKFLDNINNITCSFGFSKVNCSDCDLRWTVVTKAPVINQKYATSNVV